MNSCQKNCQSSLPKIMGLRKLSEMKSQYTMHVWKLIPN